MAHVLLMTATIDPPPGAPALTRRDPALRKADYAAALHHYASTTRGVFDQIVLADNSAADVDDLTTLAAECGRGESIRVLSFARNEHPPEYGKAYGEFRLLDHVLLDLLSLSDRDVVWKVTGRLRVTNLSRLVTTAPKSYDVYCDLRNLPLPRQRRFYGMQEYMDLRLFSCTVAAYRRLFAGLYPHLRSDLLGESPEKYLYRYLQELRAGRPGRRRLNIVPRFRLQPRIRGFSGASNADLGSARARRHEFVRGAARRLAPWLWL